MGVSGTGGKAESEAGWWGNARNAGGRQNHGQCQSIQRGPVDYTSFKCYKCGVMGILLSSVLSRDNKQAMCM